MEYDNKITLISLNDSLLQNLNTHNQNKTDIVLYRVAQKLQQKGLENILSIDCGNLFINKQHNITEFLHNNLSLAQIKAIQQLGIDKTRHGIAKLVVSKNLKNYYNIEENDNEIHISDAIKNSKNVGVLLSCVANDMMSSVWVNPISHMLARIPFMDKNALKRTEVILKDQTIRDQITDSLKINIEQILGINDDTKICTFGIFRPSILPKDFETIFNEINNNLQVITQMYNQSYIDINDLKSKIIDFHPNAKGYETIACRTADELSKTFASKVNKKNIKKFDYNNLGLDGAIIDIQRYKEQEKEYVNYFIKCLQENHNYSLEQAKIIFHDFIIGRLKEVDDMEDIYRKAKRLIK